MTDKDLRKLADMVASKIVLELFGDADTRAKAKQQFEDDFKQTDHLASIFADMSDEEMLILMIYEDKEEYEKAARILKKLKIIQGKLGKL